MQYTIDQMNCIILIAYFSINFGMENRQQDQQRASEISYLQLENTKVLQTSQDGKFIMKQTILKNLLKINCKDGSIKENNQIQQYQTDPGFLNQLFQIVQKHDPNLQNHTDPKDMPDETCDYIHKLCQKHAQANKFNIYSDCESSKIPSEAMCTCGCGKAVGEPLSLCTDQSKHYFFGPVIILYFFFLKRILILLAVIGLVYALYSTITNISLAPQLGNECLDNPGMLSFLCPIKFYIPTMNKIQNFELMAIQVWLGFASCIIWLISIRVLRSMARIFNRKIDASLDSSSDYVIQIYNLPFGQYTQNELIQYVSTLWKSLKGKNAKPLAIKSVLIIYKMDESRKMITNIIQKARNLAVNLQKKQKNGVQHYKIKQGCAQKYMQCKIQLIQSMVAIQNYRQKFVNNSEFRKTLSTDIAFLQFASCHDQVQFLRQVKQFRITLLGQLKQYLMSRLFQSEQSYIFKGNNIRITRAPQPSDINWLNCQKKNSYKRMALVWFITFIIICTSFGFLTLIRYLRSQFAVLRQLSILVSISLQAFNRIIWNTLLMIISLQQNNTSTDEVISTLNKAAFAQSVNVIVLPLIFNYVMKKNLYGTEGLVSSAIDYHFTFFFMQLFLNLLNVPYQMKKLSLHIPIVRNYIIRKYSKVVGVLDTTQQIKQVISYYENPSFSVASNYASLNTVILQTMFYLHMQPALIFFLIFNIMSVYMTQKYLLLRRCKIPQLLDFIIFQNSCSFLQHAPLVYGAGSLVWMHLYENKTANDSFDINYIPSILCIVVWLVTLLNPLSILNRLIKFLMNIFGYSQQQNIQQQEQAQKQNKINQELPEEMTEQNVVFKRKQCFFNKCGTNQLLQYQAKLTQVKKNEEYENQNKLFCQSFFLKPIQIAFNMMGKSLNKPQKKSTRKMLLNIKQSFAILGQGRKDTITNSNIKQSKKNNKVMPIDVQNFNEQNKSRASFGFENEKQNIAPTKKFKLKERQTSEEGAFSINQLIFGPNKSTSI